MEYVDESVVSARHRFVNPDALELALVMAVGLEGFALDNLYRVSLPRDPARQPNFAIAAPLDTPQQLVIGDGHELTLTWSHRMNRVNCTADYQICTVKKMQTRRTAIRQIWKSAVQGFYLMPMLMAMVPRRRLWVWIFLQPSFFMASATPVWAG